MIDECEITFDLSAFKSLADLDAQIDQWRQASLLSTAERHELARHETVIGRGLLTFVEVGRALADVRQRRLYRETHPDFALYCLDRWSITKRHANRLIQGSAVVRDLGPVGPAPTCESQVRPLAALPPEERAPAWQAAVATAPGGKVTAAHVTSLVKEWWGDWAADKVGRTLGRAVRDKARAAARTEAAARGKVVVLPADVEVRHGDFRDVLATLPDDSAQLIFADPPYDRESIPLYGELARIAARVLQPGGSLVTYAGGYALPEVVTEMRLHLQHWWQFAVVHTGRTATVFPRHIKVHWKPMFWFVKGTWTGCGMVDDIIISSPPSKELHDWEQGITEAEYVIEKVTEPGDLVVDPMCGSGTTLIAAARLGRRALGIEIDRARADVARARVHDALSAHLASRSEGAVLPSDDALAGPVSH